MESDRAIFLSMAELGRRYRAGATSAAGGPLTGFELRCFSQHGEDGVIAEILTRIGITAGFFVEFGIETGREGNCVFLADVLGWEGLFIEPDGASYSELTVKYAGGRVQTVNAAVTPQNVESLFAAAHVPPEPDVLSIDVDGQDYWIWESLEAHWPRVVVIEYNAVLPAGQRLVQPPDNDRRWEGTDYFGSSLDALCSLADRKGYRLVHTDLAAINAFFVRSDLGTGVLPNSDEVPRRHHPNYFMQGYRHPVDTHGHGYVDLATGLMTYSRGRLPEPAPAPLEPAPEPPEPAASPPPASAKAVARRVATRVNARLRAASRRRRQGG
jgi:hypothetical protein